MQHSPVPVIVLSGGLGSGKTTLLNHLLRTGVGRVGVVVNDFGDVDVDAFLVQGQVDASATISGGCLCCLSDPAELDEVLASLARPGLDLDVILVEASGLAEPRELARLVMSCTARGVRFGGVVEILDAATWATPTDGPADPCPVATDHLAVASLLVVNKTDRIAEDPGAHARLQAALTRHAPGTPVVHTSYGRLDPTLLFDAPDRGPTTGQLSFADLLLERAAQDEGPAPRHTLDPAHRHDDDGPCRGQGACTHPHHRYVSASVESDLPVDPGRFVAFLEQRPPGVYRVKGRTFVDVGRRRDLLVQAVGGWVSFEERRIEADGPPTQLVAIGVGVPREELDSALRACLSDAGPLPPQRWHALARYTRRPRARR